MKHFNSVGTKLIIILTFGIVILCSVHGMINIIFLSNSMTREFDGRIVSIGENLSAGITEQLGVALSCTRDTMMKIMLDPVIPVFDSVVEKEDIAYVVLSKNDGKAILTAGSREALKGRLSGVKKDIRSLGQYKISRVSFKSGNYLEVNIPVLKDKNTMGVISLGFTDTRLRNIIAHSIWFMALTSLIGISILCSLIYIFIGRSVCGPLKEVTTAAKEIANGNLSQKDIRVESADEIGQLAGVFNQMAAKLGGLAKRARLIAEGNIGSNIVEERLKAGENLENAAMHGDEKTKGDLEEAFDGMLAELRKLTVQARRIAADDLNNPLLDMRMQGELGQAFSLMTLKLRELSKAAERLAEGDLAESIKGTGVLSNAFKKVITSSEEMAQNAATIATATLPSP